MVQLGGARSVVDYPDGTFPVAVNVEVGPVSGLYYSKAEWVDKKHKYAKGTASVVVTCDQAPAGQKIGLIGIIASTDVDGGYLQIETLQSGLWAFVLDEVFIAANRPLVLAFPCWVPDQDVGDGATDTLRVTVVGASCPAKVTVFVLYYFE